MPELEKVICCDHCNNNDNLAAAAIMANANRRDNNDPMMAAMMGGGMFGANQWMNNPFAYMMMMAMMRMFGWNENGCNHGHNAQNIELMNQIQELRSQLQNNQNATLIREAIGDGFTRNDFALSQLSQNLNIDFNTLQRCCCEVQAQIQNVAGQVGFSAERVINAANLGDCRVIEALKDCCCQNKELVQRMGYENQLGLKDVQYTTQIGFKDLGFSTREGFCGLGREVQFGFDRTNTAVERAASSLGFQAQQDKCDIINTINAAQQRTADLLNGHWRDEQALALQDEKFKNSQLQQNIYIRDLVQGKNNCGCSSCCGCCGCNNNNGGF